MRIKMLVAAAALAALPASGLQAQYFSTFTGGSTNGATFFNNISFDDGRGCNIGFVLTGAYASNSCQNNQILGSYTAPYSTLSGNEWFAHSWGDPTKSVGFAFVSGSTGANVNYYGGIAGNNPLSPMAIRIGSSITVLNAGNTSAFVAANTFFDVGILVQDPGSYGWAYSWLTQSPGQFAAFGNGATFGNSANCGTSGCWVGGEDTYRSHIGLPRAGNDYDYQDGILNITGASLAVPEPSSILLMGSGLLGLVAVGRRRKNNV